MSDDDLRLECLRLAQGDLAIAKQYFEFVADRTPPAKRAVKRGSIGPRYWKSEESRLAAVERGRRTRATQKARREASQNENGAMA